MKLSDQEIVVGAPAELCFQVVAAAGRRLEKRSDNQWLVEFVTELHGRKIITVELVTLDPPRSIAYQWVEGPLRDVDETIRFDAIDGWTTRLSYSGTFSVMPGPVGWLIGIAWVKRRFDRLVAQHLEKAKVVAEERTRRSRVFTSALAEEPRR